VRRWFRQTPVTPLHREWLDLARDYTLHLNLHIQPRPSWHDDTGIARDVRRLYARTDFSGAISPRLRLLRADASGSPMPVPVTPGDAAAIAAATAAISAFDATDTLAAFAAVSDGLLFTTTQTPLIQPLPSTPMTFTPLLFTTISTSTSTSSSSSSQPLLDPSGNPISTAEALNLLRSTLWRM
jgi:hypothetical protein